jgi:benzodiazapine receptor
MLVQFFQHSMSKWNDMETRSISREVRHAAGKVNWWQLGLVTVAVSFLGGLSAILSKKKRGKLYSKQLKQAPWAPPGWVFSPAWIFNNFFILRALQQLLSKETLPERKRLLYLQAGIWVIYFSFGYLYFRKKSTVLAAIWTNTDAALSIASLILAARKDKKLALNYVPLTLWTIFASTIADYQALKNEDKLLGTGPAVS